MSSGSIQDIIAEEEKDLGDWPRRLLHVPTWTSYPWQPGNRYGQWEDPPYNVITYTWGRYRLDDTPVKKQPDIKAIEINGVDWDVPRIDPKHFTADEFKAVIERATMCPAYYYGGSRADPLREVEFVWLDVACIDQRSGQPRADSEVGRQIEIFSHAHRAFAWITSHSTSELIGALHALQEIIQVMGQDRTALRTQIQLTDDKIVPQEPAQTTNDSTSDGDRRYNTAEQFFSDPWFTSLWTFQEAFMRPDVIFISREASWAASEWPSMPNSRVHVLNYLLLGRMLSSLESYDNSRNSRKENQASFKSFKGVLEKTGLSAIRSLNPVAAYYTGIIYRKASEKEDQVYGAQQLFGLRLGKTAIGYAGTSWNIAQLNRQLSKEILNKYELFSQLHTFSKAADFGCAWIPNSSSIFKTDFYLRATAGYRRQGFFSVPEPSCRFRVEEVQGKDWGFFEGRVTSFHSFVEQCNTLRRLAYEGHVSSYSIFLDDSAELSGCPKSHSEDIRGIDQATGLEANVPCQIQEWLLKAFEPRELFILELQVLEEEDEQFAGRYTANGWGLVLLRKEDGEFQYYHRLGICSWNDYTETPRARKAIYRDDWISKEGFFG